MVGGTYAWIRRVTCASAFSGATEWSPEPPLRVAPRDSWIRGLNELHNSEKNLWLEVHLCNGGSIGF